MFGRSLSIGVAASRTAARMLACAACMVAANSGAADDFTVTVRADGSFDPPTLQIHDGATVTWSFADRPGTTILPVEDPAAARATPVAVRSCAYKPYDPADPNDFTGPMPRAQSGMFTLGPDGPAADSPGFEIVDADACASCEVTVGDQCLCATGENHATMDWTWAQPDITGVLIRLRWNEVQPTCPHRFDFSALDREIGKAVRNGKLYSLSIKAGRRGTPDWLFDGGLANNCTPDLRRTSRTAARSSRRAPAGRRWTSADRPTEPTATTTGSCSRPWPSTSRTATTGTARSPTSSRPA